MPVMINTPAYAGEVFLFLILSTCLMLYLLWIAFGGIFTFGRDFTGRAINVSIAHKIIAIIMLLMMLAYFSIEVVLCTRFIPYWTENGQTSQEVIISMTISKNAGGQPVAYWVTTETHRFGVREEIYDNLWVGEPVEFRYRGSDDSLFVIGPVPTPSPALSVSVTPAATLVSPSSPTPRVKSLGPNPSATRRP